MNNRTLTSANAILLISVTNLFPSPQRIQGFTADDITDMGDITIAENSMGLDGRLSSGKVPAAVTQTITLQADSLSNDIFENWAQAEAQIGEQYVASGVLIIPGTQRRYTMPRGFLTSFAPIPALRKTLQGRKYVVTWESVQPAPYST